MQPLCVKAAIKEKGDRVEYCRLTVTWEDLERLLGASGVTAVFTNRQIQVKENKLQTDACNGCCNEFQDQDKVTVIV